MERSLLPAKRSQDPRASFDAQEYSKLDILSLLDFPHYQPLPETALSPSRRKRFSKAVHAAQSLNRWTLADDSGLSFPLFKAPLASVQLICRRSCHRRRKPTQTPSRHAHNSLTIKSASRSTLCSTTCMLKNTSAPAVAFLAKLRHPTLF